MSNRTDAHSPVNLVTENYDYFTSVDHGGAEPNIAAMLHKNAMVDLMLSKGQRFASVHPQGQCDHCGARLRYAAWMVHAPTNKVVEIGETCLENRFEVATADFHKLRKAAELDRKAQRIRGLVAEFVAANPDLAFMGERGNDARNLLLPEPSHNNNFIHDVASKLYLYGELSARQIDAVRAAIVRDAERAAVKVIEDQAPAGPVPTGKAIDIEGTVVGRRWKDSDFGGAMKITVKLGNGSKVWFTEPSNIITEVGDSVKGRLSQITASDDTSFGFGKRPSRFEITSN